MAITNLKSLITNKLACIDIANKNNEGRANTRYNQELDGISQALQQMGFKLKISINPYYYLNHEHSTFTLTFVD